MKRYRIVHHIFEGRETTPTVTHVFYGATAAQAEHVYEAHMQSDAFLRGCTTQGVFHGPSGDVPCRFEVERLIVDG